jgi:hypothetical protein
VGPRDGLDDVEKKKSLTLPELELRPLGRPVRSQSLYRLHYPSSVQTNSINIKTGMINYSVFYTGLCKHISNLP